MLNYTETIAVTRLCALLGLVLWLLLLRRNTYRPVDPNRLIIGVVAAGLVFRLIFCVFTPNFYAPDEYAHFSYVRHLSEQHSLPVQTHKTGVVADEGEFYQPPLYYLMLTPLYQGLHNWVGDAALLRVARFASVILWLIAVGLSVGILSNLGIKDAFVRTFAISMISLLPTYMFISSVVNNDNLLIALGAGVLYVLTLERSVKRSFYVGLLLGAALLTKLSAVVYLITVVSVFGASLVGGRREFASAVKHAVLILSVAAIIFAPWGARNVMLYGSITAEDVANKPALWEMSTVEAVHYSGVRMLRTFWAVAGVFNDVWHRPLQRIGCWGTLAAFLGLVYGAVFRREAVRRLITSENRPFMIAAGISIIVNVALALRFGVLYGQLQGRFLFPMLVPISIFMAMGINLPGIIDNPGRSPIHAAGFFISYALAFVSFTMIMMLT
ncbi:MAG: hypothetical protein HYX78_14585 [Armatimonadetes bacterium]|nr:hypothetical protein [Armatimonadota bacterium]